MSTQVQIRRGNTAQTAAFTGVVAELTVDTDKKVVVVHDGTTAGGIPLSKESTASTIFNHANGAFDKANSANVLAQAGYNQANTATTSAQAAFDKANQTAQLAFTTVSANGTNLVADANNDTLTITSAVANGIFVSGNSSTDALDIGLINSGVTASGYGDSISVPTFVVDTKGRLTSASNTTIRSGTTSQTGVIQLEDSVTSTSTSNAATPASVKTAYDLATTANNNAVNAGTYANAAFDKANSANVLAQSGYNQANTATTTAGLSYNHANGAFDKANTATTTADAAFAKANSANVIAQSAFDNSNTKFSSSGGSITGTVSVTGNVYAGNVIANSAFTSLAGLSKLELSDIGLVAISVAGQTYQFGASGIETNQGLFGGTFGGNRLSLNSETNLISNRLDTVKIQTGTTGTTVNDFVFANTSLTVPGGITANGFTAGGINVVPTLAASFSTANAAFTRANNSLNANTGGSITGDVTVTGNLTIIGQTVYANTTTALIADNIITLNAAIGQASAPTVNAGIEVDRGSSANVLLQWNETTDKWQFTNDGSTYYDIADAGRLDSVFSLANGTAGVANTDFTTISATAGVYGNASHVPITTLTANGRVSSITNTSIAIDTAAITSGTLADARLPTKGTAGTYANATHVPVITTDAYGRVTGVTNTAISFPAETDTLQTVTTRGSTTANAINVTNTTSSTSKTTGALTVAGGVGVSGDLFAGNSIVVDGGAYGNVTTTQFASVYGQAYGSNPYSIVQVRSSDFTTGMGIQAHSGLNGLLYSNTGIQFNTSTIVRDKDYTTGGTNAGQFAANGAFIAQASLASTSNATGSIQVVGGVGVKGNVAADGIIFPDNTRQTTAATAGASIGDVLALSIALG
jgi:hypothetical protein